MRISAVDACVRLLQDRVGLVNAMCRSLCYSLVCVGVLMLVYAQICAGIQVLREWGVLAVNGGSTVGEVFHGLSTGQIESANGFCLPQQYADCPMISAELRPELCRYLEEGGWMTDVA